MGCITSTTTKTPPEPATPQHVQINIISASKTPSFCSSVSGERPNPTASNCASPSVVDGLTSVAMARSISGSGEFAEGENPDESAKEESCTKTPAEPSIDQKTQKEKSV